MRKPTLGEQELETLRFVADHAPISVGEVAAQFGEPRGIARTTVLTVMERLRRKGYLTRKKVGSAFRYAPQAPQADVLKEQVREFIEKRLSGSLAPFVAYLTEAEEMSAEEIAVLQRLVDRLPEAKEPER